MALQEEAESLLQQWRTDAQVMPDLETVETLKLKYLSKKGLLQGLMRGLGQLTAAERPEAGKVINDLKVLVEQEISSREAQLKLSALNVRLHEEKLDVTLPGRCCEAGHLHPVQQTVNAMLQALAEQGFSIQQCPEIDTDYYNFGALNFPEDHPARDMQDTFYLPGEYLLHTHTSNGQVRLMERYGAPLRVAIPGRVYRNEEVTARSHALFHQVEGVYINEGVSFGDLLVTIERFYRLLLHKDIAIRVRPSYFPFTEPSIEVDIECLMCSGKGCPICKHSGWLEVAGAGMIHPHVLTAGGIDAEKYTGFAFGMGVERLVLIRHSIPDIRLFTENDTRFLAQFP